VESVAFSPDGSKVVHVGVMGCGQRPAAEETRGPLQRYKRVKKEHNPKKPVQCACSTLLIRQSKQGHKIREKKEKKIQIQLPV
jgi:hypothetical protein